MLISKNTLGSAAVTPASGKTNFFMNEDGVPSIKDSAGAVSTLLTEGEAGDSFQPLNGNLTGLSSLTPVTDQSAYYNGTSWATYSLTAAGRALSGVAGTANTFPYFSAANVVSLASVTATGRAVAGAADAAAARTAIQAVGLVGNETVAGTKTFSSQVVQSLGAQMPALQPIVWTDGANTFGNIRSGASGTMTVAGGMGGGILIRPQDADTATGQIVVTTTFSTFSANIRPSTDNAIDFGTASNRVRTYYGVNAAINTSDARLKTDPRQLRDAEFKAASAIARLPAVWRWIHRVEGDEQNEPEGREARKHFGPTVQAAIAVMEANGLDPFAYSFICYDEWEALPEQWNEWPAQEAVLDDDGNEIEPAVEAGRELVQEAREAGDRYSFRKEELLCFIVRALAQEIDGLSERVAALEAARAP